VVTLPWVLGSVEECWSSPWVPTPALQAKQKP
jgi:hypothetical protein